MPAPARETLQRLLSLGCVPIINENDAIASDEIRYGDNDRIAALVAHSIDADVLVLLTDIDGAAAPAGITENGTERQATNNTDGGRLARRNTILRAARGRLRHDTGHRDAAREHDPHDWPEHSRYDRKTTHETPLWIEPRPDSGRVNATSQRWALRTELRLNE
ncbi:MAG: hypothetical protein EBV42_05300 [Actinobacteria bacterium]|nr:hypothetical protein [Actinomycetota bacterium]